MKKCFQVNPRDNVATLLEDADAERIQVAGPPAAGQADGGASATVSLFGAVKLGHKIALAVIKAGDGVVKYGVRIGHATRDIARGEWVHLHNCASDFDERSNALDVTTGAPTDTRYE